MDNTDYPSRALKLKLCREHHVLFHIRTSLIRKHRSPICVHTLTHARVVATSFRCTRWLDITMLANRRCPPCPITGLLRDGYHPPDLPAFGSALVLSTLAQHRCVRVCIGTCLDRHLPSLHRIVFILVGTRHIWRMQFVFAFNSLVSR